MAGKVPQSFAKNLRHNQTDTEKKLWRCLRSREFQGVKFRRQQPVDSYIVDFCSFEKRLVVELDGGQHTQEKDSKRTEYLEKSGFRVIRVWDNEIINNLESVLEYLRQQILTPPLTPTLSRKGRGGKSE